MVGRLLAVVTALGAPVAAWADTPTDRVRPALIGWASVDRHAPDPRVAAISFHVDDGEYDGIRALAGENPEDGEAKTVRAGDPRLPSRLRPGGLATVVSRRGVGEVVFETFAAYSEEGNTFLVGQARATGAAAAEGLVLTGTPTAKARLVASKHHVVAAREARQLLEKLVAGAPDDVRDALKEHALEAKHLRLLDARAPDGSRLLWIRQTQRAGTGESPALLVAGLYRVAADGTPTAVGSWGLHQSAGFQVTWRTDVDGDGVDELIVETEWAEGSTSRDAVMWDGTAYRVIGL